MKLRTSIWELKFYEEKVDFMSKFFLKNICFVEPIF